MWPTGSSPAVAALPGLAVAADDRRVGAATRASIGFSKGIALVRVQYLYDTCNATVRGRSDCAFALPAGRKGVGNTKV